MGRISTHILDVSHGRPAQGVEIELWRKDARDEMQHVVSICSNADGRTDKPLLTGDDFVPGIYELRFHIGDYFRTLGVAAGSPPFLDIVPLRFTAGEAEGHYHVPLLCSPWSYSTYRGS